MKWARGQGFIKCGTAFVLLFPTLHKNKDPVGHCDLGIIAESILRIITVWTAKHFSRTHIPLWILCLLLAAVRDISSANTDGDKVSDNRIWYEISERKNVKWIKWNENFNIRHFKSSDDVFFCVRLGKQKHVVNSNADDAAVQINVNSDDAMTLQTAGVGGNLVAIQASRMSTYLHCWSVPGALPSKMSGKCPRPWATFCSPGQINVLFYFPFSSLGKPSYPAFKKKKS